VEIFYNDVNFNAKAFFVLLVYTLELDVGGSLDFQGSSKL
jgi:hypothetical protein